MDVFNYVVARLESKEIGAEKFYFDQYGCVVAIEHGENISYAVYDRDVDGLFLYTNVSEKCTLPSI